MPDILSDIQCSNSIVRLIFTNAPKSTENNQGIGFKSKLNIPRFLSEMLYNQWILQLP